MMKMSRGKKRRKRGRGRERSGVKDQKLFDLVMSRI
jgi:hypothetical protein